MFPLHQNQDEESKANEFTALSLRTGVHGAQQRQILSLVAEKMQFTSFANCRNFHENSSESHESFRRLKRHRSFDGIALTIGSGSASNQLNMNELDPSVKTFMNPNFGAEIGECSRNKPAPFANVPVGNYADEASLYHQFVNGLSSENSNERIGYGRGGRSGMHSDTEENDANSAIPYHQSVNIPCKTGNGNKTDFHGRGSTTFRYEKLRNRMIKNRESAARSRARKQAVEAQQQLENAALKKENDLLKRVVRFLLALLRTKHMKLPALTRSFSAPL